MTTEAFEDSLTGISLTEFIPSDVLGKPSSYSYNLVAADNFSQTITYEQLLEGYYVLEEDRVLYRNIEISNKCKIKQLNRIIAINSQE